MAAAPVVAALAGAAMVIWAWPTRAAEGGPACTIDDMVAGYNAGRAAWTARDHAAARARFEPLARQGFPPAQRRLAMLLAEGSGGIDKDLTQAGLWAVLAARSADQGASAVAAAIRKAVGAAAFAEIEASAKAWKPELPACLGEPDAQAVPVDRSSARFGRALIRVAGEGFKDDVAGKILARAAQVVRAANQRSPFGRLLLPSVEEYEILPGDKYDRFVGWKPGDEGRILRVSVANLLDTSVAYAAHAIMLEAAREVYRRLPDSRLVDPHVVAHKGKKIYLSLYPDADNKSFADGVRKALDLAEQLPEALRRAVGVVDEIHYNPISRQMIQRGTVDAAAGFYNRALSHEGRRIIFIRREIKWSSVADLLVTFVHEGTHAIQHMTAERYEQEIAGRREVLAELERQGKGRTGEADAQRREIAVKREYADLWFRRAPEDELRKKAIRFECEATEREIEAARILDFDPSTVEASGYLGVCDDAKAMIARWKDERLRQGLERLKRQ
jgi:hypothetical protein